MQLAGKWLAVPYPKPEANLRLFCFPFAGAGASVFFPWAKALAHLPVELRCVQYPGRENRLRETPLESLRELIPAIAAAVSQDLSRPFAFFGHSIGALIAFETARHLRRKGLPLPVHLFVSAARPPDLPAREENLNHLPANEFFDRVAKRYQGVPSEVMLNPELRELLWPMLRADFALIENYIHEREAPLNFPISAYGGASDPVAIPEYIPQWERHTSGRFEWQLFPGDHFYLKGVSRDSLLQEIAKYVSVYCS